MEVLISQTSTFLTYTMIVQSLERPVRHNIIRNRNNIMSLAYCHAYHQISKYGHKITQEHQLCNLSHSRVSVVRLDTSTGNFKVCVSQNQRSSHLCEVEKCSIHCQSDVNVVASFIFINELEWYWLLSKEQFRDYLNIFGFRQL